MYNRQRGIFPRVATILGFVLIGYAAFVWVDVVSTKIVQNRTIQIIYTSGDFFRDIIWSVLGSLFILFPFWFTGIFLLSIFPEVRMITDGIKYRPFLSPRLVYWNEIESLIQLKNKVVAVNFRKKGNCILNGTCFHRLHSMLIQGDDFMLFLAPGLEHRDEILKKIMEMSNVELILM